MTTEQLDQIADRAEKATEGPWYNESDWPRVLDAGGHSICQIPSRLTNKTKGEQTPDTTFIAAARADVPALVAFARELMRAGHELIQSRLHQDICLADYHAYRTHEFAQRASEASCRVSDAIEAWHKITGEHIPPEQPAIL